MTSASASMSILWICFESRKLITASWELMVLRFLKFLIALILVPGVVAEVWTIKDLAWISVPAGQWREGWFVSFGAGFITWLIIFAFLPRTLWLYVLGHEFTHALAAMLAGGKVTAFKVSSKGGHVMTDRVNWWITLSPYFIPIYALIWMGLYHPLKQWLPVLYFGVGLFWAFHVTFTWSVSHRQQTDLSSQGFVFSAVIILLINLLTMLLLLGLLVHNFIFAGNLFWHHVTQSYTFTGREIRHAFAWAQEEWRRSRS
jgi:hypothetical protein